MSSPAVSEFDTLGACVVALDPSGTIADWNRACTALTGRARDDVVGTPLWALAASPGEAARVQAWFAALDPRGRPGTLETTWACATGEPRTLAVSTSAELDADGRLAAILLTGVDITAGLRDRAALQHALHESHAELSRAQSVASVGSWRLDVQRNELSWSDETHRIFGVPVGTPMTYEDFLLRVHPEDRAHVEERWSAALRGEPYDLEHRIVVGERVKWVREKADLDFDDAGALRGGVGVVQDITEQKAAATERQLWQERMAAIVSIASDAMISIDDRRRIVVFNRGAEAVFGWSAEEVLGRSLDVLIPARFRATHAAHLTAFEDGAAPSRRMGERGVTLGVRKDGQEFPAEAAVSRVEVAGQRFLTVILRDITEQKRIEDEQRFLAEFGAALMTTAPDYEATLAELARLAVRELADWCVVDVVVGGELRRLKVTASDPSGAELAAALERARLDRHRRSPVVEALEAGRSLLVPDVDAELVRAMAQSPEHHELLRALEMRSLLAVPLLARGRLLGAVVLVSAGKGRRYGEHDLRFAEEVARVAALAVDNAHLYQATQRAIAARDEVLGICAHDLRNPLNAIVMQSRLLRQLDAQGGAAYARPIEAIQSSALRMNRLIQDMLDVARLEAGPLAIRSAIVRTPSLLDEALELHAGAAASASLRVRAEVRTPLPDVRADRDRVLQVFDNLIGNAIKFTPEGGEIVVGAAPRGGEVIFWVSDTGPGMSADELGHVFDPFWQADKQDRRGAGLGLPIAKGIVEAHGGRIWAESRPGGGTTFSFTLPAAPHAADAAAPPDA